MSYLVSNIRRRVFKEDDPDTSSSESDSDEEETTYHPFFAEIPNGLHIGKQIIVRGRVDYGADRFHVNLQQEAHSGADVALHFNPRQGEGCVVRNTQAGGDWQEEERDADDFPFGEGEEFEIRFLVKDYGYEVFVNGRRFCSYGHRMPFEEVRAVGLYGNATFQEVEFHDKADTPYDSVIPGGFKPGCAVRVRAVSRKEPHRFDMNFICHSGDTAFHFNPRWDQNEVVFNASLGGWGEEERHEMPFEEKQMFEMLILGQPEAFRVYLNGNHYADFAHRCSIEDVARFTINGDVEIVQVQYYNPVKVSKPVEIPKGMRPGDSVVVRGVVNEDADRFHINLQSHPHEDADVALHFNPRQSQEAIVHNHRQDGGWGEEQRQDLHPAFQHGRPFNVRIVAKESDFMLFVDGQNLSSFGHRIPLEEVRSLAVYGDAVFHQVQFVRGKSSPCIEELPGGCYEGRWVTFTGVCNTEDCDRFQLNFQTNGNPEPDTEMAMHFNPRVAEGVVVINTFQEGNWGEEEREEDGFPFYPGGLFEVDVWVATGDEFRTYINGRRFEDFDYRLPREAITHVSFLGDALFFPVQYL